MMKNTEVSSTRVGEKIQQRMDETKKSIRDLAKEVGVTYEHIRSVVRGHIIPAPHVLKEISTVLKLNLKELTTLRASDHIQRKYGKIPLELSGKNPELEPMERLWPKLSEEHKADLIAMAKTYAHRDSA